jgi:L-fuculose-phosphate aldolase
MTHTIEDRAQLIQRETLSIQRTLTGGTWNAKETIALACRILSSHGHESGLAGQITARAGGDRFFTQRLGCGLQEGAATNLLQVDRDLRVLEGTGIPNPANRFHVWLYGARADVQCIVHTHPPHASALSMLGVPLRVAHMDACALYENVAFLAEWPGVPVGDTELGEKRALLLAHHGIVVAGRSVEEACILALQFERAAQLQLLAASAGEIRDIAPSLGREAREWLLTPARIAATFAYFARCELERDPLCLG